MEIRKLKNHKYAQAWMYRNDRGEWGLMSYSTKIIIIKGLIMADLGWDFDKGPVVLTDDEKRIIKAERRSVGYIR